MGIAPQASLLVPMTIPPVSLPSYVNIDRHSPWHVSALLSMASESVTLPSRLHAKNGIRDSLDDIAASLNINGNQNIVKLQMSISSSGMPDQQNRDHRSGRLEVQSRSLDPRLPFQEGRSQVPDPSDEDEMPLDMDFFPPDEPDGVQRRHKSKKVHVFGRAEALRGIDEPDDGDDNGFDGRHRAKRRAAGLPIIHK